MAEKATHEESSETIKTPESGKPEGYRCKETIIRDDVRPAQNIESSPASENHISGVDLHEIIDAEEIQSIMDDLYRLTNTATAILDLKGRVIEATGWQDLCTKFHRKNPKTARNCTESDLFLAKELKPGEYVEYKCKNGLWDVVTPLYVGSRHVGNIYTGQFFYDDEEIDEEFFVKQAEVYGFDKDSYMEAFRRIPRCSRKTVRYLIRFLVKFAAYVSRISFANIRLETEIRERRRAERERGKLQAQLLNLQRMESIGNLAGGIAHDFNNILSSIIGFAELAMDDAEKGTPQEDNLQDLYTAGIRAKKLVQQILTFARQSEEDVKPIRVKRIAKESLGLIRSLIPTNIKIQHDIRSDSMIMGSATQIHQIFMNLCTNAIHAMEENGGVLSVSLKDERIEPVAEKPGPGLPPRSYLQLTVSDTGGGIPVELGDLVFDPYFTTKGVGKGTGMGLAVVHGIVQSCGGKITVESESGKGTTFLIHLPITEKRDDNLPCEPDPPPTGTEHILLVDDEAPIAKMGGQTLQRLGYQVSTRTSSLEALALFKERPTDFDLVVTDMTMPNMTGDKLAEKLMEIRPDIPVILCTGYSNRLSPEAVAQMGIKAFASKPLVKAELARTLRQVLDERKPDNEQ